MFSKNSEILILLVASILLITGCNEIYTMDEVFSDTEISVNCEADYWTNDSSIHAYIWCNYAIGQNLNEVGLLYTIGSDSAMEYGEVRSSTKRLSFNYRDVGLDANADGYTDYYGIVHELYGSTIVFGDYVVIKCSPDTVYSIRPFLILNWANIIYGEPSQVNP